MISEQIKEHPLQPLHSQKLHTQEAVGNPSGPRWYWINLSCRSETNWHKLIQSPEHKDKCALYLWCNWEQTMSSGDLTAPFYEKNTVLSESLKSKSVSCCLCPIPPKQSLGAGQHHPPGHSVPSHNLWPLMPLLTTHWQNHRISWVGKSLRDHQVQPNWCRHLVGENISLKDFVFYVLVRPWVNDRWPPGAANWIKGHKLPWFGKGNSVCEETNWHTELWSTSPPRQVWTMKQWAELLFIDALLCWEDLFSGSITVLVWGEQD